MGLKHFTMRVADLVIRMEHRYDLCKSYCRDYIIQDCSPDLVSTVTEEEIEQTLASVEGKLSRELAEITALYRPIAQKLPSFGGFVVHGACLSYGEKGYLFTAPSGTGKSTHLALWQRYLGEKVQIVNGDKPIVTVGKKAFIHGTPWAGKERWQKNISVPLDGICLLTRGEKSNIRRATADEFLPFLFQQIYLSPDGEVVLATMELLDRVLKQVPVYLLACDISEEAARLSFEAMTGENWETAKEN